MHFHACIKKVHAAGMKRCMHAAGMKDACMQGIDTIEQLVMHENACRDVHACVLTVNLILIILIEKNRIQNDSE